MARISAGQDFGQRVAEPAQSLVPMSRAAFGATQGIERAGAELEHQGLVLERQEAREAEQARRAADAAVAQSKLYGARDQLNDALEQLGQGIADGSVDKTRAANEWTARTKDILAEAMDGVPDAHRQAVQLDAEGLAQRLTSKVGTFVRKRDQADTVSALNSTLEYTQRMAVSDPDKARAIMSDTLAQLGPHSGLTPDQIRKAEQGWVEQTSYTRAFTALNAAKNDNNALSVVERGLAENQDLDPQRKAVLLGQVEGYRAANEARALRRAQQAEIAAARAQRESSAAFTVLSGWALAGKAANPEANAQLIAKLSPTDLAAYKQMAAEVPARAAAAMLPISTQQQQLDELMAIRNGRGTDQRLEQEISRRQQVLAESQRDYTAEPLRAAQERGILEQPLQPLNTNTIDGIAAGMAVRVQQAQTAATRTGRAVSPLLSDEAGRLGDMLNALPPAQRAQQIARIASVMPAGMTQALAAQIDAKDKGLALELAAGSSQTTSGRFTAEWIARGRQAIKDKTIKEDNGAMTGLRAQIAAELGDALTGKAREDVIEAARLAYLGQQAGGESPSVGNSLRLALGGPLIDFNGRKIPAPAGFDERRLQQSLSALPADAITRQTPDGMVYLPGGKTVSAEEFLARLPDAQLEPAGTGRYVVRSGGSLAMSRDARPIVVQVR